MNCPKTTWALAAAAFGALFAASLQAQPLAAAGAASDTELARRINVGGLRVAGANRIAIVNDRLVGAGEQVDGIEVLEIERDRVHLRAHGRTFAMRVGSSLIRSSHHGGAAPKISDTPSPAPQLAATRSPAQALYGPVAPGQTLSQIAAEIADNLRPAAISPQRLMAAVFAANPDSFGADMHTLYAGATLRVPSLAPLGAPLDATADAPALATTPALAAAPNALLAAEEPAPAARPQDLQHGTPARTRLVRPGDTLSEIAVDVARTAQVTLNQAMHAIYDANPQAFGRDMHRLYAGAVLELPAASVLQAHRAMPVQRHLSQRANATGGAAIRAGPPGNRS